MDIKNLIENQKINISSDKINYNQKMSKYTSFKIGGEAECLIKVEKEDEVKEILNFVNSNNIPLTVLGNGSNVLVLDKGIKGITLINKIEKIKIEKTEGGKAKVTVGAGEKLGKLARILLNEGITGFEELSGIPGTIGGAVRMNAGAHGREMKDIVTSVKVIDGKAKEKVLSNEEMEFDYRKSLLSKKDYIVTEVELELCIGNKEEIQEKMEQYAKYRKERQPIEFPNAGSIFKRGTDFITAKLIDDAGLKGYSVGDAQVSTKHSGFIINNGNATAKDTLKLIEHVENKVYEKFNKKIELEIEIVGEG